MSRFNIIKGGYFFKLMYDDSVISNYLSLRQYFVSAAVNDDRMMVIDAPYAIARFDSSQSHKLQSKCIIIVIHKLKFVCQSSDS